MLRKLWINIKKNWRTFFEGNSKKSFDKMTSEVLDKIKQELKQVAIKKQKEVDSRKNK